MIEITVNERTRSVAQGTTVAALLAELDQAGRPVAVEVNLALVPKARHEAVVLQPGDRVEIVTLVGGG